MFKANQVLPGIWHIVDTMGVCMTLITGQERALLVDTGYGIEDVRAFVRSITKLPLTVFLTHGHHDHALGSVWFDRVLLFEEEQPVFECYTGAFHRKRVAGQAAAKGITVSDDFLTKPFPVPEYVQGLPGETGFQEVVLDLGGLSARILKVPGHTLGSAMVAVPERSLLLTADNWNPCTWVWFPESCGVKAWRDHTQKVLAALPYQHVLCSHQFCLFDRNVPVAFLQAITDEAIQNAPQTDMGSPIHTCAIKPDESSILVFDKDKINQ